PAPSCLACGIERLGRNAPAPQARCPFPVGLLESRIFQQWHCHHPRKPPCPTSRGAPACPPGDHWLASAPSGLGELFPAGGVHALNDKRPRSCPAAVWFVHETHPRPWPIAQLQRKPCQVPDAVPANLDVAAMPLRIPSQLVAFDGERSSSRPSPDVLWRNQDKSRPAYQYCAWTAVRWRGRGSTANPHSQDAPLGPHSG